nr:cupin domain-containing protein [Nitrospiraceae bacterium]
MPGPEKNPPEDPEVLQKIREHGLHPHPEGGYYREIHRSMEEVRTGGPERVRGAVSVILFLIPGH